MNRRQKFLSSTMVSVTLALMCFLLILAISNDFQKTWDLTADQRHSFSKQTDDFVGALGEPVKFYAFVNPAGDSSVVEALLDKYQRLSHNFSYEIGIRFWPIDIRCEATAKASWRKPTIPTRKTRAAREYSLSTKRPSPMV